jgi:osmotically-inducible protein OsmY
MPNRYGNRNRESWQGDEDRRRFDDRGSQYGRGGDRDWDSDRESGFGSSGFGGQQDYSSNQYFGSGGQQYGQGYTGGRGSGAFGGDESSGSYYGQASKGTGSSGGGYTDYDDDRGFSSGRRFGGSSGGGYGGSSYRGGYSSSSRGSMGGGYSDRDRFSGGYGQSYGRQNYGSQQDYGNQQDRGWWDRTSDEVAAWFGDEEAERRRRMDEQNQGQHRGRGPRNYTRSDDRIKEDVNDRLTDHTFLDASDIDVEVNNGEVVLTGTVDSRWAKRQAEDIAEDISGVKNVENRIRVKTETFTTSTSDQTNTGTESARGKSA